MFGSVAQLVKKTKMINNCMKFISNMRSNETTRFSGMDDQKSFRKNLKKQSKDWIYRHKEIVYQYNEQGFRNESFDQVDWAESVVITGCSNIKGVGVAEEDTLAKQLERIIGRPVVNMGLGGTGVDIACWNSTVIHAYYPWPKAIIHFWSSFDRYTDKFRGMIVENMVNLPGYQGRLNWCFRSKQYIKTDRELWKDKIGYIEGTYFEHSPKDIKEMRIKQYDILDRARDLVHPGIETFRATAEDLAEKLKPYI